MGIPGLWDIIGEGEVISIAKLASECFAQKGRPLRIAVDEAAWRFNNLTDEQTAKIQEGKYTQGDPAAHPIEKAIFYRAVKFLLLNVQLLFVFDGPHRPWKRGKRGGQRVDYKKIELTTKLLNLVGIPAYMARGEAEAECARLQQEGVVDAVLSEDGDSLMFGTRLLFKAYYESKNGKKVKSNTHVRVYRASEIEEKHRLDKEGMICLAMLSGGDYSKGLHGCGPGKALRAAQRGLGRSLCEHSNAELRTVWRLELMDFLKGGVPVPPDFPDLKILKKYKTPEVGPLDEQQGLRALQAVCDGPPPINEMRLRSFLRLYFNIWTKGYIKYILPLLLVKSLTQTQPDKESSNKKYDIKVVNQRKRKRDENEDENPIERKITFNPKHVSSLDLTIQPNGEEGEDWSQLETKTDGPFDPAARAECEILECLLERGVPYALKDAAAELSAKEAKKTKAKRCIEVTESGEEEAKHGKKRRPEEVTTFVTSPATKRPRVRPRQSVLTAKTDAIHIQKTPVAVNNGSSTRPPAADMAVIDLTLDSDAEDMALTIVPSSAMQAFSGDTAPHPVLHDSIFLPSAEAMLADMEEGQLAGAIHVSRMEYETIDLLDA